MFVSDWLALLQPTLVKLYMPEVFVCKFLLNVSDPIVFIHMYKYRKVPKFWDARNLCCNLPKIQTKKPNLIFCLNGTNGIANTEDPDQTVPLGAV